jgi:hypothetical protein
LNSQQIQALLPETHGAVIIEMADRGVATADGLAAQMTPDQHQ